MKLGKTYGGLLAGLICLFGAAAGAQSFDFEKEHEACVAQPAYSAGGAAVGRCFDDQAAALDRDHGKGAGLGPDRHPGDDRDRRRRRL